MSLFPVYNAEEDTKKKPSTAWLTIGSSYEESVHRKKQVKPETAQTTTQEDKNFFNVGQRMTAKDLIDLDESEESDEAEVKRRKHKKKKKKEKKKKHYNPVEYSPSTWALIITLGPRWRWENH